MKLKQQIKLRHIGNEYMLVADNDNCADYTRVISLNETAAFLLENAQGSFDAESWAALLEQEYGVEHDVALRDAGAVITDLAKAEVIVED